jgi:hypothetical protein
MSEGMHRGHVGTVTRGHGGSMESFQGPEAGHTSFLVEPLNS